MYKIKNINAGLVILNKVNNNYYSVINKDINNTFKLQGIYSFKLVKMSQIVLMGLSLMLK